MSAVYISGNAKGFRRRRAGWAGFTALAGMVGLGAGLALPVWADDVAAAEIASDSDEVSTVIVTGSRRGTTEYQSLSPVSVVTSATLEKTGEADLRTALSAIAPSYLASQASNGSSSSKPVRTAALRGLGGNHVLVLVNGRRRHNTSLLNNTGGSAGAPVDLALIPTASVARIEVLSDGASAQYGSDAIGGVINIILKKNPEGGVLSAQFGSYDDDSISKVGGLGSNAFTSIATYHQGFGLGTQGGFLNVSADYKRILSSNVVGEIGAPTIAARVIYADPNDPREQTADRFKQTQEVVPWGWAGNLGFNLELPVNDAVRFYATGTYSGSSLASTGTYRSENNPAHIIGIAPDGGYVPTLVTRQKDYQLSAGFAGDDLAGWVWDASLSYGRNRARMYVNGVNASLGFDAEYRDEIYVGQLQASEALFNLDLQRSVATGLFDEPLDIATGIEYRYNDFSEGVGEEYSYLNGGFVYPTDYISPILAGRPAGIGSPFMTGFTEEEAGSWNRNNYAAYADFSQTITPKFKVGLAARYEHYSDFGGQWSGKLSARYELTDSFALRAAVNNGFRAPSLAEQYTTKANQGPFNNGGTIIQVNAYNSIRHDAPAAVALGAKPIDPETSINYSLGFVARPTPQLDISLDVFQIEIDDRIGLTGQFNGTATNAAGLAVAKALRDAGIDPNVRVQYFTNVGDTLTRGLEFKANYRSDFGHLGLVNWSLSTALNRQSVTRTTEAPADLAAAGLKLLQDTAAVTLKHGAPKHISKIGVDWTRDKLSVRAATTYYSRTLSLNTTYPNDPRYNGGSKPAFITDASVSYRLRDQVSLTVGANNLFNQRAENQSDITIPLITTGYVNPTPVNTPYGRGGRFSYVRLSYDW
ncbi:MAG: TonB-dependent receptor [Asticcacaulis sp.]